MERGCASRSAGTVAEAPRRVKRCHLGVAGAVLVLAFACRSDREAERDTASIPGGPPDTVVPVPSFAVGTARDTVYAQPRHWNLAEVEGVLRAAGMEPVAAPSPIPAAAVGTEGTLYDVGGMDVFVFLLSDPIAAGLAGARIDTAALRRALRSGPGGGAGAAKRPSAFTSNNMLVVTYSTDSALARRVERSLTRPEVEAARPPLR